MANLFQLSYTRQNTNKLKIRISYINKIKARHSHARYV